MSKSDRQSDPTESRQWVGNLLEGNRVDEVYLVWRKNKLMARNGRSYLAIQVGDRTGRIEARVWDRADEIDERFEKHDLVLVRGQVVRYQERLQLKVDDILPISSVQGLDSTPDMDHFLPTSPRSVSEMWSELLALVDGLADSHLRNLVRDLLDDPELAARFQSSPAAKSIHHAWRGGLLEHTLSVCGLVQAMWSHYEEQLPGFLDRSLLIAGAIIHDLGKVYEMDPVTFEYTDEGRLIGHMSLMLVELDRRIRARPGFPRHLALQLEHMLLSHHGELEFGSPKRPKIPEAWVLHYADILDGRMMWMSSLLADMEPGQWSGYQRLYDRYFWKAPRPAPGSDGQDSGDRNSLDDAMGSAGAEARRSSGPGGAGSGDGQKEREDAKAVRPRAAREESGGSKDGPARSGTGKGASQGPGGRRGAAAGVTAGDEGGKSADQAVLPLLPGLGGQGGEDGTGR